MSKTNFKLSIVCASNNGLKKLPLLINSIKKNTYHPFEIIICLTNMGDAKNIDSEDIKQLNIKIILSKRKNQLYQRHTAINASSGNYILQLDDDVILKENTLENYIKHFSLSASEKKIVCAVVKLPNNNFQSYRWNSIYKQNYLFRFILYVLNNFNEITPMSILESGRIVPLLVFNKNSKLIINVEWLNSCMMYNKSALKEANFIGKIRKKSYFEDVFFSHSLYRKNYQLIIDSEIEVCHDYSKPTNLKTFLNSISSQYFIVKTFNKNYFLFIIDIFIFINLYLISSFLNCFKIYKKFNK